MKLLLFHTVSLLKKKKRQNIMKKSLLSVLTMFFLLTGCTSLFPTFESSTGNIGQSVDDGLLINALINQVFIQSPNVTSATPLRGKVRIESSLAKAVSGKILFEITIVDSFQPIWVANIDVRDLNVGEIRNIPFTFYSEDIGDSIDFVEVNAERELFGDVESPNRYSFDLIVRSQINESRLSFTYYKRK